MNELKANINLKRNNFFLNANLSIPPGIYGLFGPSGSGKSTFLNTLSGLVIPQSGKISFAGRTIFDSSKNVNLQVYKRNIAYVFQEGRLFPHLSVKKNLFYSSKSQNLSPVYYNSMIDLLNIRPLLDTYPSKLSGGERQRVAIGRALFSGPEVMLLDEPFSALDKSLKKQIINYLDEIFKTLKIPIILVSHELKDILLLTKNLILVKDGNINNPETYLELIRNKQLLNLNHEISSFHNVYDVEIGENGEINIIDTKENYKVIVNTDTLRNSSPGIRAKVSLRASDVSIALKKIDDVSIRNQLAGTVEDIISHYGHYIVIVNCGIPIITRITKESTDQLSISKGKRVYCLFKSMAIESSQ